MHAGQGEDFSLSGKRSDSLTEMDTASSYNIAGKGVFSLDLYGPLILVVQSGPYN
jgi:hypothetical protein